MDNGAARAKVALLSPRMNVGAPASPEVLFCIPLYNDWASAQLVVEGLAKATLPGALRPRVLLVDDGSSEPCPAGFAATRPEGLLVEVLRLRRNLGHQRAIAIGLAHAHEHTGSDVVVVLDADGEDPPSGVPDLLAALDEATPRVVFAQRVKRSEGLVFRVLYQVFKLLHRLLVGRRVEVGNFSAIPRPLLERIVSVSEIWNHYAAGVYKARIPTTMVPIPRAKRLLGRSKMSFVALVTHGLSAMSVWGEQIGVRLLVATSLLAGATMTALAAVVGVRFFTALAIPGWATTAAGLLLAVLLNAMLLSLGFIAVVLQSRNQATFLPLRDYAPFVLRCVPVEEIAAREA